jgi:putative copper export protein
MTLWNAMLWLHLVAMAFFVGGQLMLAAVVVPVLRGLPDRARLRSAARRFGMGTLLALAVLIATGAAMATHDHRWGSTALQVKLGLVVLVGGLVGAHTRWPAEATGGGAGRPARHALECAIFLVSLAIVWLGVVVAGN